MRFLLISIVSMMIISPTAHGSWRLSGMNHTPDFDSQDNPGMYASSWAWASATALEAEGMGWASEPVSAPVDTMSAATAVGILYMTFVHSTEGPDDLVGEVEYEAEAQIDGVARLIDDHCTAVAVGFVELEYIVDDASDKAYAEITKSAASTMNGTSVAVSVAGFSFNIQDGVGEGEYPDTDRAFIHFKAKCPATNFTIKTKTRSQILVWCNEFWGLSAECEAEMGDVRGAHGIGVVLVLACLSRRLK